jgi:hypothetical protein
LFGNNLVISKGASFNLIHRHSCSSERRRTPIMSLPAG